MSEKIIDMPLSTLTEEIFLDYAREVIGDRALPDVRDGLKPVQRRILWSMHESGYAPSERHRKCARIVGDVMGKYHPHGDSSVYGALVKLQQPFVRRCPLVDGHGNFGTVDDNPAAMRYTEARLSYASLYMLSDIEKNAVDFGDNYDASEREPTCLPARIPNLLINGGSGIAVGVASEIPTHNPVELIDAVCAYLQNPSIRIDELMTHIKGPDFPTGGIINPSGLQEAYHTGRGSVQVRGIVSVEKAPGGKQFVVISSLPYQTSKESLLKKIADIAEKEEFRFISAVRDESSGEVGFRIVVEVLGSTDLESFIRNLYQKTDLQKNYHFNMVALVDKKPVTLSLKQMISEFVSHRKSVFCRTTQHDIDKANQKLHVLYGLLIAVKNLDLIIKTIKESKNPKEAKAKLVKQFDLSGVQAQAVLDLRLQRLTMLEIKHLKSEIVRLETLVTKLEAILASPKKIDGKILEDLREIRSQFESVKRLTIVGDFDSSHVESSVEKFVLQYIGGKLQKRRADYKGDRGVVVRTHSADYVYACYSSGVCERFPSASPLKNLPDHVAGLFSGEKQEVSSFVLTVSSDGMVKKTPITSIAGIKRPLSLMKVAGGATLIFAQAYSQDFDLILVSNNGYAIRFSTDEVSETGPGGIGIRCMKLSEDKRVVEVVSCLKNTANQLKNKYLMAVKRQKRGGRGTGTKDS